MNGGYVMVDCMGLDLGDPGTVSGLYAKVKTAISADKPIQLYNLKNSTKKFTPVPAYGGVESETSVFLSFFSTTLHISSSDVVTI